MSLEQTWQFYIVSQYLVDLAKLSEACDLEGRMSRLLSALGNPLQYSCLENPMDKGAYSPWGHKKSDTTERLTHNT